LQDEFKKSYIRGVCTRLSQMQNSITYMLGICVGEMKKDDRIDDLFCDATINVKELK
jgi:hypothetical protein